MKKMTCCLTAFSFLFHFTFFAQESPVSNQDSLLQKLKENYETKTILSDGFGFEINGAYRGYGLMLSKLKAELKNSSDAKAEFKLFEKKRNGVIALNLAGLGLIVTGASIYDSNKKIASGLILTGCLGVVFSLPLSAKASRHLSKSIWLYNRDAIFK